MKRNISDLLDQYPAEDIDLGGNTLYSKSRIEEITMKNIKTDRPVRKFTATRLLIAVGLAAALSVSAFAAGRLFGAGEWFQDFFQPRDAALSQGQLEAIDQVGQVFGGENSSVPASVTSNGATITPVAVIADENVYYIRLRVEAPEGIALPDLDSSIQGYYQLEATLEGPEGAYMEFGCNEVKTVLDDDDPTDNHKEFVLCFYAPERETDLKFNDKISKVLTISGLWIQSPDKEYTPIFTGDFVFDFAICIQSRTIALDAAGLTWHHELLDYTNTVKSMSLSPLSLSFCVDSTMPYNDWISPYFGDVQIVLKDGTVFFSQIQDNDALNRYIQSTPAVTLPLTGQPVGVFRNYIPFDEPLDLSKVDYVTFGDVKIPVNVE